MDDEKLQDLCGNYSADSVKQLKATKFDRKALGARGLSYEKLDQLTMEIIHGRKVITFLIFQRFDFLLSHEMCICKPSRWYRGGPGRKYTIPLPPFRPSKES